MSDINTKKIKAILESEKQTILSQLNAIDIDKTRKNGPISPDWGDQAQEIENDEVIDQLESLELNKLKDIEAALIRLENGSYETCVICNSLISESRIKAIPFTDKCIKCG